MVARHRRRLDRAIIHDASASALAVFWSLSDLVDHTPHHQGVRSWDEALDWLEALRDAGHPIRELQLMSHGYEQGPVINDRLPTAAQLRRLRVVAPHLVVWWLRCCSVGAGLDTMARLVELTQLDIVAHCEVISAGRLMKPWIRKLLPWSRRFAPWRQGGTVCYTVREWSEGRPPAWDPSDRSLPVVLATRFEVPDVWTSAHLLS